MSWGVPGRSSIHFKSGDLVSKVFPGMLTVSLLTAEGLPKVTVRCHLLLLSRTSLMSI